MSVEVDFNNPAQSRWLSTSPVAPKGGGVAMPYVFIMTSDGVPLFAESNPKIEMRELLAGALNSIGPPLTQAEKEALVAAIAQAETSFEAGDLGQAVSLLMNTKGANGSSVPAIKAKELLTKVGDSVKQKVESVEAVFTAGDGAFKLAYDLYSVAFALPPTIPIRKTIEAAVARNQRHEASKQAIAAARDLARADHLVRTGNEKSGIRLYQRLVDGDEAAAVEVAAGKLKSLGEEVAAPAAKPDLTAVRTWTDVTGRHKIEAKLIEVKQGWALLERSDGEKVSLPLEKLSPADRKLLEDQ